MTTQVKFTIESGIVAEFKARCASEGASMTSVIRQFMAGCKPPAAIKAHTRPLRRKAVEMIIDSLKYILRKEEEYRDAIPEQFTQRHDAADMTCDSLSEAIECLSDAFQ